MAPDIPPTSNHLYDTIGTGYNSTRQADPYITQRIFSLLAPQPNGRYLDIGCGTGNYTIALAEKGLNIMGIEPSLQMLNIARQRSSTIIWKEGSAESIPASDAYFDGVVATLTIHHWKNLAQGFREVARVLQPKARFVVFTSLPEQTNNFWLSHYFPRLLRVSADYMPSYNSIAAAAHEAGLRIIESEKYDIRDDLQDHFFYTGKNNPERYFRSDIRNGISSFSALANAAEVEEGLQQLRRDIDSGNFTTIRERYHHDGGDYLFLVMENAVQDVIEK